ncbi:MAG: hypothetical protein VX712_13205 [Bacteroidota bacterium]|uniref:hypothetical protein n=1 Tax=Christiangramia sp. TaxID=1931228 RepID=UPI000C65D9F0|nr:hypothetical protein [Christiangramia sp.]MEE2773164.1 hypothetical protein [Bacteroidota bacterium]|tara:strand:+ start:646 stop:858 length:213 start_codon:yes stop_codon:yes gene_type:complete
MFFKFGLKILFIAVELFLGFYSLVISDSLMMKFVFFVVTAAIIAFIMIKMINKVLPQDKDFVSFDLDQEE